MKEQKSRKATLWHFEFSMFRGICDDFVSLTTPLFWGAS